MNDVKINRALISVFDKTGLKDIAACMDTYGVEIISSGGTAKAIRNIGYECIDVTQYTGYPESPGGLVKTLQPKIHGGLLLDPNNSEHAAYMKAQGIEPIDLVAVNLYAFKAAAENPDATPEQVFEMIDIGGPAMIRAAAKGGLLHGRPCVIVEPGDYELIIGEICRTEGCISDKTIKELAVKAFKHTAEYEAEIVKYFGKGCGGG
jgi:phosphoribosylaminoimidazolecarboxamide formyltransferase/IMP cyclohydrolase